ncbi:MAG: class I SAM-dependent rRNA methyltransferase [Planctomycetota bacterium]|nr:class I SAM-dependent rRNA methyltransferase [Planctomycetota bacterium]
MSVVHVTGKARRWLASGHPWVYRDDVAEVEAEPGDVATVVDPAGAVLGQAFFSAQSRIALRFVSREKTRPDRAFFAERIARAVAARARDGYLDPRGACRLLAGDADLLPGFVLDRYANVLVAQCGMLAADRHRDLFVELARASLPFEIACVYDRSDSSSRKLEGLVQRVEVVDGALPTELIVHESGMSYSVDVAHGHKTGHYLDQRDNRLRAADFARDVDVLDAFSYDGLFGIRAALAGAKSVVCVDQSKEALERAAANAERNGVRDRMTFERANCMHDLRDRAARAERFGLVIVDPPAFAKSRREVEGAERGYIELNRRAFEITAPGGMVVSASCSFNVRAADFQSYLARASYKAARSAWLTEFRGAGSDHPVLLTLPETNYLKCAFVRVG